MLNKLSPFFAVIFSIFLLKEKTTRFEWSMLIIAFAGALFVIKPSFNLNSLPALIGVLGGLGAGLAYTYVRRLGTHGIKGPVMLDICVGILEFFFS